MQVAHIKKKKKGRRKKENKDSGTYFLKYRLIAYILN